MRLTERLALIAALIATGLTLAGLGALLSGAPERAFALAAWGFVTGMLLLGIFMWRTLLDVLARPFPGGEAQRAVHLGLLLWLGPAGALLHYVRTRHREKP